MTINNLARLVLLLLSGVLLQACSLLTAYQDPVEIREQRLGDGTCSCEMPVFATRQEIEEIQARLILLGYPTGGIDGIFGKNTSKAIKEYQADQNLLTDGRPSTELLVHIRKSAISNTADR